ncbi:MAG: phytoene/squalene synthase family protein [Flavobacteriales bacterium]|nr:phytoene/squalene synthase family protein [Flavobacteriales bacterium]
MGTTINRALYDQVCLLNSKKMTRLYSTSFSLGAASLASRHRNGIYAVYGFVRLADEIVDTFHDQPQSELLSAFESDTWTAIEQRFSLNPVLHAFQMVYHEFQFTPDLVDTFLRSMEMDLTDKFHDRESYEQYIVGSAEVVGLMCLRIFIQGKDEQYEQLKPFAMKLGAAFQKINFLRDMKDDYEKLGRTYFPSADLSRFDQDTKDFIEQEIEEDFRIAYEGIKQLPRDSRFGVYVAYVYYYRLFQKIKSTPAPHLLQSRIRIPNQKKYSLFLTSYFRHSFNLL